MSRVTLSRDLFALLKQHIDLPDNIVSMRLTLGVDRIAEVECTFLAQRPEIGVTRLAPVAKEYVVGTPALVTKRYKLVEIKPIGGICDPHAGVTESDMHAAVKASSGATLAAIRAEQNRSPGMHSPPAGEPVGLTA